MDLKFSRLVPWGLSFAFLTGTLFAAPKLRLEESTVGPLSIPVGQAGLSQTVEAYNAGDGVLQLTVESSDDWITAAMGANRACTERAGVCTPINIQPQTAALAKGIHTGTVTVSDPNAIDAPQTITVTVQMGGAVPDQARFYVAPNGGSGTLGFTTTSQLTYNTVTQSGGNWLSMSVEGGGSFRFEYPYQIKAQHPAGLAEGVYKGTINVTSSAFAPDIKAMPVTMQVTSQPIATVNTEGISAVLAADSVETARWLVLNNRGMGDLAITTVTADILNGDGWLMLEPAEGTTLVSVKVNPAELAPGLYEATITVETNAVNSPHVVPVRMTIVPQQRPTAGYRGVVSNATFEGGAPVAQGDIVAVFGSQFSFEPGQEGSEVPLVREMGGAKVFVNGVQAPLFYTSYGQINFQIPVETAPGDAMVQVMREDQPGNIVSVSVQPRAPRLLRLGIGNYGIIVNQDGTFPIPVTAGIASRPAKSGDWLTIYGIGFGPTTPAVGTGDPAPGAEPFARWQPAPTVIFGGGFSRAVADPYYIGMTPNLVGLYQVNVQVPGKVQKGNNVLLSLEGSGVVSNLVELAIE